MIAENYEFVIKRTTENGETRQDSFLVPRRRISTVLEGLVYISENLDGTLSFRHSCGMEICGSCSMVINGKPRMACSTIAESLGSSTIKVSPLPHYNVIRDLVVDIGPFFEKYKSVKPYIIRNHDEQINGELLQTPEQFKEYEQFSMCIKCGLCLAACPISGSDEDYLGPAALAAALRYNLDSRDEGSDIRLEIAGAENGTSRCHYAGECSEVCPKDVDPSKAIQLLRRSGVSYELKKTFRRGRHGGK